MSKHGSFWMIHRRHRKRRNRRLRLVLVIIYLLALLGGAYAVATGLGLSPSPLDNIACEDALTRRHQAQTTIWETGGDTPEIRARNLEARTRLSIAERDITSRCAPAG